jgi:hypothetical protein
VSFAPSGTTKRPHHERPTIPVLLSPFAFLFCKFRLRSFRFDFQGCLDFSRFSCRAGRLESLRPHSGPVRLPGACWAGFVSLAGLFSASGPKQTGPSMPGPKRSRARGINEACRPVWWELCSYAATRGQRVGRWFQSCRRAGPFLIEEESDMHYYDKRVGGPGRVDCCVKVMAHLPSGQQGNTQQKKRPRLTTLLGAVLMAAS